MIDVSDNVAKHLAVAWRHMIAFVAKKLDHLHIGSGQYAYLFALYAEDGQSQQSLSDRLFVDKSYTVAAINKLESLGYVERRRDSTDRRYHRIFLTEQGRAIRPELETIIGEVLEILQAGLSDTDRRVLSDLMRRVAENMSRANS